MPAEIWTQTDIDRLKVAVGSGVLTVQYAGPPERSVTYQSLGAMRALLAEMRREVNGGATFRLGATSKGLNRTPGGSGRGGSGFGFGGGFCGF